MLDVQVSYEQAQATVRYQFGKVRLAQILKRYEGSRFTVLRIGPIQAVVRQKNVTIRAWADPAELSVRPGRGPNNKDATGAQESEGSTAGPPKKLGFSGKTGFPDGGLVSLVVDLKPADQHSFASEPNWTIPEQQQPEGLRLLGVSREVKGTPARSLPKGVRRFRMEFVPEASMPSGELAFAGSFRYVLRDQTGQESAGEGTIEVPLLVSRSEQPIAGEGVAAGLALVGGSFRAALGHLCNQKGCVEHLHEALSHLPSLAGVRPIPGLDSPGARIFVRAGQPIDVWALRQGLRDRGVELRRMVAEHFGDFVLAVQLPRWRTTQENTEAVQCAECRELAVRAARSLSLTREIEDGKGGGLVIRLPERETRPDLAELLDSIETMGVAPSAIWLVPDGVQMPDPPAPRVAKKTASPKLGGSEAHPLIQLNLGHLCSAGPGTVDLLDTQKWTSRTGVAPAGLGMIDSSRVLGSTTALVAVGDRRYAELTPLVRELRAAGRTSTQIVLSDFGEYRIQCDFAHICGEVEYSKPPKKKKRQAAKKASDQDDPQSEGQSKDSESEGNKGKKHPKKTEKPFVPKPLRPAASSNGRKAIERAVAAVPWISEVVFQDYHTRPEFKGPRRLLVSFYADNEQVIRLDQLIDELTQAGFPPTRVRVSSLFAGIPFGFPLPGDLELVDQTGESKLLSSFRRPGRPLAVAFVSLNCPKWDKYKYEADPAFYSQLKETMEKHQAQVDFVAISSNPDDEFDKVSGLLKEAGLDVPLLRDPDGRVRAVFNAQIAPPPHLFVFDANGLHRYAGDAHDHWNKPDEEKEDYLAKALELVLAGKYKDNAAVFYNKSLCNCSSLHCKCPKCGCGATCRCAIKHCRVGF